MICQVLLGRVFLEEDRRKLDSVFFSSGFRACEGVERVESF